jgi:hypothetical protein
LLLIFFWIYVMYYSSNLIYCLSFYISGWIIFFLQWWLNFVAPLIILVQVHPWSPSNGHNIKSYDDVEKIDIYCQLWILNRFLIVIIKCIMLINNLDLALRAIYTPLMKRSQTFYFYFLNFIMVHMPLKNVDIIKRLLSRIFLN